MADDGNNNSDLFGQMQQDYPWTRGIDPGGASNAIDPESKTSTDAMGDVLTNYMPQTDPNIRDYRDQILGSITDDQKSDLFDDYQRQTKSGGADPSQGFGNWMKNEGGDQFFRGFPTGEQPAENYTDQQKQIYGQMQDYLTTRYANMPGSALQAPAQGMPTGALGSGQVPLPGVLTPQSGPPAGALGSGQPPMPAYATPHAASQSPIMPGGETPGTALQPPFDPNTWTPVEPGGLL